MGSLLGVRLQPNTKLLNMPCKLISSPFADFDFPRRNLNLPEYPNIDIRSSDMQASTHKGGKIHLYAFPKNPIDGAFMEISLTVNYDNTSDMYKESPEAAIRSIIDHLAELLKKEYTSH